METEKFSDTLEVFIIRLRRVRFYVKKRPALLQSGPIQNRYDSLIFLSDVGTSNEAVLKIDLYEELTRRFKIFS